MNSHRRSVTTLITMMAVLSASAWAGRPERDTLVYQFGAAGLADTEADLPATLARRLARALDANMNVLSMDDVAGTLGCDPAQRACLDTVLGKTGANKLVFGTVTRSSTGKLKVVLTIYSTAGGKDEQSYVLSAAAPEDAADELVEKADEQINGPHEPSVGSASGGGSDTAPRPPPGGADSTPGISSGTYALIGVGAASTMVGVGFLLSAHGLRNEIADHPTTDRNDFAEIMALESAGKTRTLVGYGLTSAGVALGVYGIYRALHEREPAKKHSDPNDPGPLDGGFSLVPVHGGGAAVTFSGHFL